MPKIEFVNKAIVFHHIDADGYCAGYWAVKDAVDKWGIHEENVETVTYNYGEYEKSPEDFSQIMASIDERCLVYVVDITLPLEVMEEIYKTAGRLIWIDHHGTSMTAMHDYNPELSDAIMGFRYDGIAASELAYFWYAGCMAEDIVMSNTQKGHVGRTVGAPFALIPCGTLYVSDNDTWSHVFPQSKPYAALIRKMIDGRPKLNTYWFDDVFGATEVPVVHHQEQKAKKIYGAQIAEMTSLAEEAYECYIVMPDSTEYTALIIDTEKYNSEMFDRIDKRKWKDHSFDIFVKHYVGSDGLHHYTVYRGNSEKSESIHCGVDICKPLGGGGHPGAAGFTSKEFAFELGPKI